MEWFQGNDQIIVNEMILFGVFAVVIVAFLILDLGYFGRKNEVVSFKKAFYLSVFWIAVSLAFGVLIYYFVSPDHAYKYLLAYVVEKSLAVDNVFIFLIILQFFNIEEKYYHKILFWGIIGAIFFRLIFITAGLIVISYFHWILYVFGAFLIYSGVKLLYTDRDQVFNPDKSAFYKFILRKFRYIFTQEKGKFFLRKNNKIHFTTLFLALILIEFTDIVFAVDSIPAVLAITQDPFIVYTSNIFAILGLRAMFFMLAGSIHRFSYIQQGLSFILIYIGVKMMLEIFSFHVPPELSLAIVLLVLTASILLSLVQKNENGNNS